MTLSTMEMYCTLIESFTTKVAHTLLSAAVPVYEAVMLLRNRTMERGGEDNIRASGRAAEHRVAALQTAAMSHWRIHTPDNVESVGPFNERTTAESTTSKVLLPKVCCAVE